ncbi:hypothetical protein [Winogradskyella sp.]|uniref:hypothetical protein n=1 Tax=Winogradskyella sp. TaxID=1883156 RepID=UPI003BAC3EDE
MKKTITLLLLLALAFTHSQTQIIKSNDNEAKRKINYAFRTSVTENGDIINLSVGKKQSHLSFKKYYTLSLFNKDMTLIKEKDISKVFKGSIMDMEVINNNVSIIVAEPHELRMKTVKRYYCSIDDLDFKEQVLYESNEGTRASKSSFSKNNTFMSLMIGDRKVKKPNIYFTKAKKILLFSDDFKERIEIKIEDFHKKKNVEISDIYTLENGSNLIVVKNYKPKHKSTFSYDIIKINQDSQDLLSIDTQNKFVKDLKFFIYENQIYLAGHYSDYYKKNDLKGFYISKLNVADTEQEFIKISPFKKEYMTKMNLNTSKKSFKQINHLEILDFYVSNDSYFLLNEASYNYSLSQNQTSSNFSIDTWYYGNMAVNKFDNQGNLTNFDITYKTIPTNNFYPIQSPISSIKKNDYIYLYLRSSVEEKEGIKVYKFNENKPQNYEFKYDLELNKEINECTNIPMSTINSFNFRNDYLILFTNERQKRELVKIIPN